MMKSKSIIAVSLAVLAIISAISIVNSQNSQLPGTSIVMGYVRDEAGNLIEGCLVRVIDESSGEEVGNCTTGPDGFYLIKVEFPSVGMTMRANITASKEGYHTNYKTETLTGSLPPETKTINLTLKEISPPDEIPPKTEVMPTPPEPATGWWNSSVMLTFHRYDDGGANITGVNYTAYKIGAAPWEYESGDADFIVNITEEGCTTVLYYSVDKAGNNETVTLGYIPNMTVCIDKTEPIITSVQIDKPKVIHDINITTDYKGAVNGIKITRDGTDVVGSDENLTIGETYKIRYKLVNGGDFNETVHVTVRIANESWSMLIEEHNYSLDAGESKTCPPDEWDTSGLAPGAYTITVNASIPEDAHPEDNERTREVMLELPLYPAPNITSWYPEETVIEDIESANRTFNISINQTVNVSWPINGTEVFNQSGVNFSEYTNESAVAGYWEVTAHVFNENGSDMHTWLWSVKDTTPPASVSDSVSYTHLTLPTN